jgi:hypothetical protein
MDLTTGWNFDLLHHQEAAKQYIKKTKPFLIIGSPECRCFSQLQSFSKDSQAYQKALRRSIRHINFVCDLYRLQLAEERFFLHEHPWGASSWQLLALQKLCRNEKVVTIKSDQCMFGQTVQLPDGTIGICRKATGFCTNSPQLQLALAKTCDGTHTHSSSQRIGAASTSIPTKPSPHNFAQHQD